MIRGKKIPKLNAYFVSYVLLIIGIEIFLGKNDFDLLLSISSELLYSFKYFLLNGSSIF